MATETPTYPQFTNLALESGLFDQLMATVKFHIQEEYSQQRITSADYSRVFLGAMEAALSNTTQFLIAGLLIDVQRAKIEAEIRLLDLEGEKLRFEIDFMYPAQLIKLQQEGLLIEAQIRLTEAQILKIEAEILLLESQKLLIDAQIRKIDQEIIFLQAKTETELANTTENFAPGSVIGRQTALLKAQQLGFAGELELKISKLHADYAAVFESVKELDISQLTDSATGQYTGDAPGGIMPLPVNPAETAIQIKSIP